MNRQTHDVTVQNIEEPEEEEQVSIRLINVIFLPFHPAVRVLTLVAVIVKSLLGPFVGTYPEVACASESEIISILYYSLLFYEYFSDVVIGVDLFLHIVHRQVTEEASKREFAPKSLTAITLDLISLIPFFSFISQSTCPPTKLWPNILALTEALCFYRVIEYFDLKDTHSIANIFIGYILIFAFLTNLVACFIILLTYHGLCSVCTEGIYDWRLYFKHKDETMDVKYSLYDYAIEISTMNIFSFYLRGYKPATCSEYVLFSILMIMGFLFMHFVIGPKTFAEMMLRAKRSNLFGTRANRIMDEATKRNPSLDGDNFDLENYFSVIWKKMEGVTVPPEIISDIPQYMKLHMKEDIAWAIFHHSPTLRRTSTPYKRWLYDRIILDYKMPGERLFSGHHCYTHLYYLKAGIVQLISADDGATPVLSVTGGSLFGDINFILPPLHRQTLVRCLTYCEIIIIPRDKLLTSMHKFPEDRRMILKSISERIKHAKRLNSCKTALRGSDRTENEGLAWLKTRWWDLWNAIQHWKKSSKKDTHKCRLPPEKSPYHCSKYIGQLVLCKKDQLQLSTIFAKVTFPWILSENSSFTIIWHKIVKFIVIMVLILLPPNVAKQQTPDWFDLFIIVVDIVYVADLFFNIITNSETHRKDVDFKVMVVAKFKGWRFMLDVVSCAWLTRLLGALGHDALAGAAPLARLLKLHVLFDNRFDTWKRNTNLLNITIAHFLFSSFSILYVMGHTLFLLVSLLGLERISDVEFLFGPRICRKIIYKDCESSMALLPYYYILQYYFGRSSPQTHHATWINLSNRAIFYLLEFYWQYKILAAFYLKHRDISKYNILVTSLKWFYRKYQLHPDALKRVERYFLCHWKHNYGLNIMYPNAVEGESQSTYWVHHGRPAERIIGASRLFTCLHSAVIRDLAEKSRFSLLPRGFTLLLFGVQSNCVTWIVNGELKCEYENEEGDVVSHFSKPSDILMLSPLFLGLPSFKTYVTATDCEILYITKSDFFKVMKAHPEEWFRIKDNIEEFSPIFVEVFGQCLKQHQSYQKKLRDRIFHDRKSVFAVPVTQKFDTEETPPTSVPFETFISSPEAPFVRFWITARMFVVLLSIVNINLRSFCIFWGLTYETIFFTILNFCDFVGFADIIVKLFLPYFDSSGLIVSDYKKCMKHYLMRGFILDLIGTFPWKYLMLFREDGLAAFAAANEYEIYSKYAHLYMVTGYFNYITDKPGGYRNHVLFIKWQLVTFLVTLAVGNFYFLQCFEYKFDKFLAFVRSTVRSGKMCWNPNAVVQKLNHTSQRYNYRIAGSVEMALNILYGISAPDYDPQIHGTHKAWVVGLIIKLVFWFVCLYSLMLLMLDAQTNISFKHGVQELIHFLKEERVEKPTIERCMAYYNYIWIRTRGVNAEKLYEDIGTGNFLSQDVNFYINKKAYEGLNTIFKGGELLERKLSGVVTTRSFLPNEDIMREMDIMPSVYIVLHGQVVVSRRGRKLATLTTGGLFGQLSGEQPRPVRVTATTADYTDVLEMSIEDFVDIFAQDFEEILNKHRYDFIKLKKPMNNVPLIDIEYMIRGIRIFKLPFIMSKPVDIRSCVWYERFLYFIWMWVTTGSLLNLALGMVMGNRPVIFIYLVASNNVLELLYLLYYLSELFTMELVIVNNNIECRYLKWKLLFQWSFIVNTLSLVIPKTGYAFSTKFMIIAVDISRMLRIHVYFYYYEHFCNNFQNKYAAFKLKLLMMFMALHTLTCLWILTACGNIGDNLLATYRTDILKSAPEYVTKSIDRNDWSTDIHQLGCRRKTLHFNTSVGVETGDVISKHWYIDYAMSFWYMLTLLIQIEVDSFPRIGVVRIVKIFAVFVIKWCGFWISAAAISLFFTNCNELYTFEQKMQSLETYFKRNGLSKALLETLTVYAKRLWKRQRGSSLPGFAQKAPQCLKQDIFGSLYMHHLRTPMLFQVFPEYFLRQLAVRLTRKVVFPGNFIVQEGDVNPTLYFIHDGEVEKWCTDAKGESKLSCVLTMNGYFGLVPALFPDAQYQYAYYSRTVVDLICLNYTDWKDLLDAYPDIKETLYKDAQKYTRGGKHGKSKLDA